MTQSEQANLRFPVGRVARQMHEQHQQLRVGTTAPVFQTAVLEYITSEVLEAAISSAKDDKRVRILPRHLHRAIQGDDELKAVFDNMTIPEGGVVPDK